MSLKDLFIPSFLFPHNVPFSAPVLLLSPFCYLPFYTIFSSMCWLNFSDLAPLSLPVSVHPRKSASNLSFTIFLSVSLVRDEKRELNVLLSHEEASQSSRA